VKDLDTNWSEKQKELLALPKEERDKNAYFKVLLYTFRFDILAQTGYRLF
jgi:hypothetical protein